MSSSNEWTERKKGEFRRPLYGNELPMAVASTLDGSCGVVTAITVRGASLDQLAKAWKHLPLHLPLVRLQLARTPGIAGDLFEWVYHVPLRPEEEITSWTENTFVSLNVNSQDEVRMAAVYDRCAIAPVDNPSSKPVAKLFVGTTSTSPTSKQAPDDELHVTLLSHHSMTEARCSWMILDLLLSLGCGKVPAKTIPDLQWGRDDVALLPLPIQYAAGLRKDGDVPPVDPMVILGDMEKKRQASGPPCLNPDIATRKLFVADWQNPDGPILIKVVKLSRSDYATIHKLAKAHGATVTSWMAVIIMLLQWKFNVNKEAKSVQIPWFPIDNRWRVDPSRGPYFGAAAEFITLYHQDLDVLRWTLHHLENSNEEQIPSQFWKIAAGVKSQVELAKNDAGTIGTADPLGAIFARALAADPEKLETLNTPGTFYSSMGKVGDFIQPNYIGPAGESVTVHDVITHSSLHNSSNMCYGLMECDGELRTVIQFARSVYTAEFANTLIDSFESLLAILVKRAGCWT